MIRNLAISAIFLGLMCGAASAQRVNTDGIGVTEWEEWSFANKEWWAEVAGGQDRALFGPNSGASGTVAIVDPDEWDDRGAPSFESGGGLAYNSQLLTPTLSLAGVSPGSLTLEFASSWRPENTQQASVQVFYDGVASEVLNWSSIAGANFKADAPDELVSISLPNAGSATSVRLAFNMFNAANDWWWAIDNVKVLGSTGLLLNETFEGVTLGQPIDEAPDAGGAVVFGQEGPSGWEINTDSYVPPIALGGAPHFTSITRVVLPTPATLKLQVDPVSGVAQLVSVTDEPVTLTGYEITSDGGSINAAQWSSTNLDARNVDSLGPAIGDSWDTVLATSGVAYEAFLNGSTTIDPGQAVSLGKLFNPAVGVQDLEVAYSYFETDAFGGIMHLNSQVKFLPVTVEYLTLSTPLVGDYNDDGAVDAADYTVWRDSLGATGANLPADGDGNMVVNQQDYVLWKTNFGSTAATAAPLVGAVPEPAAVSTALLLLLGAVVRRHTGR